MCRKKIGRVYANISCGFSLDGAITEDFTFLLQTGINFLHFLQRIVFVISNVKRHYDKEKMAPCLGYIPDVSCSEWSCLLYEVL